MAVVHSYSRYSGAGQELGDSERRQVENAAKWCKAHGHVMSDLVLIDKAKSAYKKNKQKALTAFMAELGKRVRPGDILLVEAVDRISRRGIDDTQRTILEIWSHGVDIAILSPLEKIYRAANAATDLGAAIELASFAYGAHVYSVNLSKRLGTFWEEARDRARKGEKQISRKKLQNGFVSGNLPAWLDRNGKPIPKRAETIRFILGRVIVGIGLHRLARIERPGDKVFHEIQGLELHVPFENRSWASDFGGVSTEHQ